MLTERIIRDAKPTGKTYTVWDGQVTGLGLQVTRGGKRNFVIRYKVAGRKRQAILCRAGGVSLRDIRKRASDELMRIRAGETDPLERRHEAEIAPTVNDLLERFFGAYAPERIAAGRLTEKTVQDYRKQARRYVGPRLGTLHVAKVTRHDVERFAARMVKTPAQRNRTLAFLSRIFTLAEHWEWRPQHTNPVRGIERAKEQARDRVLAPSELAALAGALDALEAAYPSPIAAIRVAAMTGLRTSECLSMAWEHVSFETARATLPKTKTGRRVVPLAAPVLDLLHRLPHVNGNAYVFAGGRGAAVTYKTTRRVFADACERAGLADVRLHDLRRSVATNLAASGLGAFAIRDLLGHSSTAMANRYVRLAGDALTETAERAAAMTAAAMAGKTGEVVQIDRRHG